MNDAIILQHCLSVPGKYDPWNGIFYDMLRLAVGRHSAYARAHRMDYRVNFGDIHPEQDRGAWGKVWMILDALKQGYEHAIWLDTDAAIMDMQADLRDALPAGKLIGAVTHDPAASPFLAQYGVPKHHNVGVLYVKNGPRAVRFFEAWAASYPGDPRWMDQGTFNTLAASDEYADIVASVDDKYNATINVNIVDAPAVKGYHGIMPPERRLAIMHADLRNDYVRFRIGD